MENTIDLIIGGVDISEFVESENYSVKKIWKTSDPFTAYDGSPVSKNIGWNYSVQADLENIPDGIMRDLTKALDNDSISVIFTDPHSESGKTADTFRRSGTTGGSVACGLDDGLYWNVSISLNSEFHTISETGGNGGSSGGL